MGARGIAVGVGALALLAAAALATLGAHLERLVNRVDPVPLPEVSPAARGLHASSAVVDLHADSLLFGRDLLRRSRVGHVDVPRLREGGVALQVLAVPTRVPLGFNFERTDGDAPDLLTLAGWLQRSRLASRGPLGRALGQAERLRALVERAEGRLLHVRTRADLDRLVARRAADPGAIGLLLALEGAHALEGDPDHLEALFDAGYRMIGLAHFFDNGFAGSAHGLEKGGLSEAGRRLVDRMDALGVLVDVSHASPAALRDALALTRHPVVASHGGVRGTCAGVRNLADEQLRAIARGGGVIGIGFWDAAVCGRAPRDIASAIRHAVAVAGEAHVALGSDFDGATVTGFDAGALPALTQAMLEAGLPERTIRAVLGGNALRVLRAVLPER